MTQKGRKKTASVASLNTVNLLKTNGKAKKSAAKPAATAKPASKKTAALKPASNSSAKVSPQKKSPAKASPAKASGESLYGFPPYENERFTDFAGDAKAAREYEAGLEKARAEFGEEYPSIIAGEKVFRNEKLKSVNPSRHAEIIGLFQKNGTQDAKAAVEAAAAAFETWKNVPAPQRAKVLVKAAALMRKRKHEFSAVMTLEVAKNWAEADADTAEAIDFLEFYAREAMRYAEPQPIVASPDWMGETNEAFFIPLGVVAVLPPWNFPLAILAGMTTAAIVTGNTVVLKPSPDAMRIAYKFFELMDEAGLPNGVLNFLTGGADVGETMVEHPKTRMIAFTGSKAVGLHINEMAAKMEPGQKWIKRVIAEMGGKDAIIVDSEADLDLAAAGVSASAFGFSGQKCSACSRAIIDEKVYDEFISKLLERAVKIKVDEAATNPDMSAVSGKRAFRKIAEYIELGKLQGRLILGGKSDMSKGYFIEPTIFADVDANARIAQEEIFGPVLACIKAKNFDDALRIANGTDYGLTGGVFTKNKEKLERAKREFFVGNLYLNRKCTGALVGVHPFGGFNMSGTDSKAGSREYLALFMQAKAVATKTLK